MSCTGPIAMSDSSFVSEPKSSGFVLACIHPLRVIRVREPRQIARSG